jgi:hypothetical protein
MKFRPVKRTWPGMLPALALICALATAVEALRDWQSLAQLRSGDRIRLSLKTRRVDGAFQHWSPEEVTLGTVSARREEVLKVERYRPGAWGRGKKAAVGAAIGFGGGFAFGAAVDGCNPNTFDPICGRGKVGAVFGAVFAIVGAGVGAVRPTHTRDLIYSVK